MLEIYYKFLEKYCEYCGKKIENNHGKNFTRKQKYCSTYCSIRTYKLRKREKRKKEGKVIKKHKKKEVIKRKITKEDVVNIAKIMGRKVEYNYDPKTKTKTYIFYPPSFSKYGFI